MSDSSADTSKRKDKSNAYWVIAILGFLLYCFVTQQFDLFLVIMCTVGLGAWLFGGVFSAMGKVLQTKKHKLIPGKYLQEGNKPDGPMPVERTKVAVESKQEEVTAGEETPAIAISKVNKTWFTDLVKNAVHILIIGETNSGKSTAAKAILRARADRGEQIIILDPHARPSTWNGLDAIGRGRDYQSIETMIGILQAEMDNRYKLYAEDDNYNPTRLNIFVDEVPSIATYCESWQSFFTVLSCEARKVNMSLICLSQSRLVDMLGIKGRSDVRENFTELLLGEKAIRIIPDAIRQTRPAVVDYNGKASMIDTSMLPALGSGDINAGVLWVPDINIVPQKPAQTLTAASEQGITTAPLTAEEKQTINDWEDEAMSRREMARRLYKSRGGKSIDTYRGDGPISQLIKNYLDNDA